ncbi:glycosyltransferase [Paenibacillus zeisoli]|uniref:Glycosyltransferase n=1 Tax=Paenibacillus zeisoli TaxID=2496267 RepID=A0A3S1JQC6_9BACL|nr:glycosyltransferase [Paenibacillus zeisoli]RUT33465.1 glycosyltransferase [Paenibacillus zeisoli]
MRIAYLVHWNEGPRSGVFKKVAGQISEWTRLGHRVALFLFTSGTGEEWGRELGGVEVVVQSYQGGLSRLLDFRKLAQRVRQWGPDVLYHRFDHYYYSLPALLRKFSSVLEINSNDLTEMRMDKDLRYHFHRLTRARVLKAAAGTVFVSRELSEVPEFSRYTQISTIIGNGINLDDFLVSKSLASAPPAPAAVSAQTAADGLSRRDGGYGEAPAIGAAEAPASSATETLAFSASEAHASGATVAPASGAPGPAGVMAGLLVLDEPGPSGREPTRELQESAQLGHQERERPYEPHQPEQFQPVPQPNDSDLTHHPEQSQHLQQFHQMPHPNQPPARQLGDPSVQQSPAAADAVQLVFIGSPGQAWHGVDAIAELAKARPQWSFDLIGVDASGLPAPVPVNMTFHGRLARKDYQPLLERADLAIGTLALYRKQMKEASPLKVREYMANGLPVITAYEETDFPEPVPFILQLPNSPGNVRDGLAQIDAFASAWRRRKVPRKAISHLDTRVKESQRLSYMKLIREKGERS